MGCWVCAKQKTHKHSDSEQWQTTKKIFSFLGGCVFVGEWVGEWVGGGWWVSGSGGGRLVGGVMGVAEGWGVVPCFYVI